ncbi:MAG TPA: alpha/beta hydrolase [Polyangiaceae bacterium]|jgi:non-heme chloroperoxidase|nr:alpha/beta hydrolase [Polyangiaceae bacterium]
MAAPETVSPASRAATGALTRVTFRGEEGITLVGDAYGDPGGPPVILMHGGGQTRHAWGDTAAAMGRAGYYAIALDGRGHGESDWSPSGSYLIDFFIADLKRVKATLAAPPVLVGASLGGLTALLGEGESPGLSRAVVLVDIATSAKLDGIRRIVDFMSRKPEGYASLEEVADAIADYQPQRKRPTNLDGLAKNVRRGADGRYRWHWDPKFLRPSTPEGSPLRPDRLQAAARALSVPALLVRGKLSDVLGDQEVQQFLDLVPHAQYVDVSGAGHMIAGDSNDLFTEAVLGFLDRLGQDEEPRG